MTMYVAYWYDDCLDEFHDDGNEGDIIGVYDNKEAAIDNAKAAAYECSLGYNDSEHIVTEYDWDTTKDFDRSVAVVTGDIVFCVREVKMNQTIKVRW